MNTQYVATIFIEPAKLIESVPQRKQKLVNSRNVLPYFKIQNCPIINEVIIEN